MNFMGAPDLASAAAPIVYASKALGLAPYSYVTEERPGGKRHLQVSRPAQAYGCMLFVSQLLALGFYFLFTPKVDCEPESSTVVSFVEDAFRIIFFLLGAVELLIANTVLPKKMVKMLRNLEELHRILLGQNKNSFRCIFLTGCLECAAITVGLLVMVATDLKYSFCNAYASIAYFMTVISYTTTCLTMTQYINLTLLLYFSFKKINHLSIFSESEEQKLLLQSTYMETILSMMDLKAYNQLMENHKHESRPCEYLIIRSIRKLHFALCSAMNKINNMFSLLVAFETLSFVFTIAVLMFYVILYFGTEKKADDLWVWLLRPLSWTSPIVWKVVGISVAGELASTQARRTAALVQRALLWGRASASTSAQLRVRERELELERFAAQLSASCTELRAAGGLRVDLGLLGAAASATVTYIIVMLQFYKTEFTICMSLNKTAAREVSLI